MENQDRPPEETTEPTPDETPLTTQTQENPVPAAPVQTQLPRKSKKRLWLVLLATLVLLAGGAVAYFLFHKDKQTTPLASTSSTKTSQASTAPQLCFVRLGYLVCTDATGGNRVRYNLPLATGGRSIASLSAAPDQSVFIATTEESESVRAEVLLLNSKLEIKKKLTLPDGFSPLAPTLSNDGKTVLLRLYVPRGNQTQTYKYTLATDKLTKVVDGGLAADPQETKDGHVLYSFYVAGGSSWVPYIMDAGGSNAGALPGMGALKNIYGFSYDVPSDTVYVFGTSNSGEAEILFGTVTDLVGGKPASVIPASAQSSGDEVVRLSPDKILINTEAEGQIIAVSSGKQLGVIPEYGATVGWLKTASFKQSAQQTEQPHERIIGLSSTPSDFQTFIKQQFDQNDAKCKLPGGIQFYMRIQKVVRDSFADVGEGCGDGTRVYYVKTDGMWAKAFSSQMTPMCDQVNKYKFTKEIFPECYDSSNVLVTNTNA